MPLEKSKLFSSMGIEAIAFDLDDTLWPCAPAIAGAEKAYFDWINHRFPKVSEQFDATQMLAERRALAMREPELSNDVTELRRRATRNILQPYEATEADIDEAIRVCVAARQNVSLFDDVPGGLQLLCEHYPLGSITNGNADLNAIGIREFFKTELAATLSLPAKPAADMFFKACEELNVQAGAVLYVGDNPVNDVVAARDAGMYTAWINRSNEVFPADIKAADFVIADLNELVDLALSDK